MNALILLLLLCGCGNQNSCGDTSCGDNGRRGGRENRCDKQDECGTRDRARREERWESGSCDCDNDERNGSRECDRFDGDGFRPSNWHDFPDLNRGENCGCEENNHCDNK